MAMIDRTNRAQSSLACVYFPFVSIGTSAAYRLSSFFSRILLYQPVGGTAPPSDLHPLIESGDVELRIPFEGITDTVVLFKLLKDWKQWIQSKDHQELAYFKVMQNRIGPAYPITQNIVSQIKGMDDREGQRLPDDLSHQLFLLLAQERDSLALDFQEHLAGVKDRYQALHAALRADRDEVEEADIRVVDPVLTETEEDRGATLTDKYLAAWNHLFQKDPVTPAVLVTDSLAVFDLLLESTPEALELSQPTPNDRHDSFDRVLTQLVTNKWSPKLEEALAELKKGRVNDNEQEGNPSSLELRVVPNVTPTEFLSKHVGASDSATSTDDCANTVFGLWRAP